MIAYETRLGKITISEAYLSKLIGHEVTSCFGVVGMVPSNSRQKIIGRFQKNEPIDTGIKVIGNNDSTVRAKLDPMISEAFKKILSLKKITVQDFLEEKVKSYVLENIYLVMSNKGNDK